MDDWAYLPSYDLNEAYTIFFCTPRHRWADTRLLLEMLSFATLCFHPMQYKDSYTYINIIFLYGSTGLHPVELYS